MVKTPFKVHICGGEILSLAKPGNLTVNLDMSKQLDPLSIDLTKYLSNSEPTCPITSFTLSSTNSTIKTIGKQDLVFKVDNKNLVINPIGAGYYELWVRAITASAK